MASACLLCCQNCLSVATIASAQGLAERRRQVLVGVRAELLAREFAQRCQSLLQAGRFKVSIEQEKVQMGGHDDEGIDA